MAKKENRELSGVKKVELSISRNLFFICSIITLVVMSMVIIQFFSRGTFPPPGINFFYMGILFIYAAHKEMLRWLGEKSQERKGEWFVYSWIVLTVVLYVVNFLSHNMFEYDNNGSPVECLRETTFITLEVCAVFILTRFSKILKLAINKDKKNEKNR
ncbi:MAG: hypothetical protein ABH967_00240 [Patescibacteria group bacterium]